MNTRIIVFFQFQTTYPNHQEIIVWLGPAWPDTARRGGGNTWCLLHWPGRLRNMGVLVGSNLASDFQSEDFLDEIQFYLLS